jgi:Uma2 family endonuclease
MVWEDNVAMATQPIPYVTADEYLEFDRSAEFKHEYVFGEIVPMASGTPNHSAIGSNINAALWNRLRGKPCRSFDSNLRLSLRRNSLYSYADVTVVCGQPEYLDDKLDTVTNPKLVAEVLSPSTRNYDLGDKTRAYWSVPSLTDLLLVEQDKVSIEYWSRVPGGEWIKKILSSVGDTLKIDSLGCELPAAEIYDRVEFQIAPAHAGA